MQGGEKKEEGNDERRYCKEEKIKRGRNVRRGIIVKKKGKWGRRSEKEGRKRQKRKREIK